MKVLKYAMHHGKKVNHPTIHAGRYTDIFYVSKKIKKPSISWAAGYSTKRGSRWNWTPPYEKVYVPSSFAVVNLHGVTTMIPVKHTNEDYSPKKSLVKCYWLEGSRGHSHKIVEGYYYPEMGIHAENKTKLKKMIAAKIAAKSKNDPLLFDKALKCDKVVNIREVSKLAGNCRQGTAAYLERLFDNTRNRISAKVKSVVRLAKMKRMENDQFFKNAVAVAINL